MGLLGSSRATQLLVAAATAIALVLAPLPAHADTTVIWTAASAASESFETSEDNAPDATRPMRQDWDRGVSLFNAPGSWPTTISVATELAPATLHTSPTATPVTTGTTSTYSWSNPPDGRVFLGTSTRRDIATGFAVSRELAGGRGLPGGAIVRRHFVARFVATRAIAVYGLEIQFMTLFGSDIPIPPQPVIASDPACSPAPTVAHDPLRPRWHGSIAAGGEVVVSCDVTLANTTADAALYAPVVVASEFSSTVIPLAAGETFTASNDPVLGRTEFRVTPPSGVLHQGQLEQVRRRFVVLNHENRADIAEPWFATYSRQLHGFESGDRVTNAPREFYPFTSLVVQSPGYPTTIRVTTTIPAESLFPFPAVTPIIGPSGRTYTWTGSESFLSASLSDARPVVTTPGVSVVRELTGGRELAPRATGTRTFRVTITNSEALNAGGATITFQPSFPPPGSTPVVATANVNCPGGEPFPAANPTLVNWAILPGALDGRAELVCTVDVTNTSDLPARYMPAVDVFAYSGGTVDGPRRTDAFLFDDPNLGAIEMSVSPSEAADGTLRRTQQRGVRLEGENRTAQEQWNAIFTAELSDSAAGDVAPDVVRPFSRRWSLNLSKPPQWAGTITAATTLDTQGWFFFPSTSPTVDGSLKTYTWANATDPFMFVAINSVGRVRSDASFGASIARELVGGRTIAAGTSVRRSFVIWITPTTDATFDALAFFDTAFGPPGGLFAPVTVLGVSCPGAVQTGPLTFRWPELHAPVGTEIRLECAATLSNATANAGEYIPGLNVQRTISATQTGPLDGRSRFALDAQPLGEVTFEVTPPAGALMQGTLSVGERRLVQFTGVNLAHLPTTLTYTGATEAFVAEPLTLAARLSAFDGSPIAGRAIEFAFLGTTASATTGPDGIARLTVSEGVPAAGSYEVQARFTGEGTLPASSATAAVLVKHRPTTLTYVGDTAATFGFAQLAGRLVDTRSGAQLGGKTIAFSVDGVAAGTAVTDAAGLATLHDAPVARLGAGVRTVSLSFAGDSTHAASTATGVLTVANSAGKVTGGVRTLNGARVEFTAKSDGTATAGLLEVRAGLLRIVVRDVIGLGISPDGRHAVLYGRTEMGDEIVALLTDAGEPGRDDRVIIRMNGTVLTADGGLADGNLQIHK